MNNLLNGHWTILIVKLRDPRKVQPKGMSKKKRNFQPEWRSNQKENPAKKKIQPKGILSQTWMNLLDLICNWILNCMFFNVIQWIRYERQGILWQIWWWICHQIGWQIWWSLNLVTNQVNNLGITKFGDKIGDVFGDNISELPKLVTIWMVE